MIDLYRIIREERIKREWTQQQLAELVDYKGKSMIAQIEKGKVDLPIQMITKFAKVFGVSELYLMGWEDSPKNMPEPKLEHFALIEKYEMLTEPQRKLIMDTIDSLLQMNNI